MLQPINNNNEYEYCIALYRELSSIRALDYQANRDRYFPTIDQFFQQLEEVIREYQKSDSRTFTQPLL